MEEKELIVDSENLKIWGKLGINNDFVLIWDWI